MKGDKRLIMHIQLKENDIIMQVSNIIDFHLKRVNSQEN